MSPGVRACLMSGMVALTACAGGGSSAPRAVPAATHSAVTLTILIDGAGTQSSTRRPRYLSPAMLSLSINVTPQGSATPVNGFPQTMNVTPTSNGCGPTLGGTQCTLSLTVVPGSYDLTLTTYDGLNATGAVLSAAQNVPFVVSAGTPNSLSVNLGGVPTSLRIIPDSAAITGDPSSGFVLAAGQSAGVTVVGVDADNNIILGPGAPVVGLTSTNPAQYPVSGPPSGQPNRFTVSNVGGSAAVATLDASVTPSSQSGAGPLVAGARISATPSFPAPTLTALTVQGVNVQGADSGMTVNVTLTGTNFTGGSTVNVSGTLVGVSNVVVTSLTSITASFAVDPAAAQTTRNVTVTTAGGTTTSLPFTVTSDLNVIRNDDAAAGNPPGTGGGNPAICGTRCCPPPPAYGALQLRQSVHHHAARAASADYAGADDRRRPFGQVIIDGGTSYRAFFVDSGRSRCEIFRFKMRARRAEAAAWGRRRRCRARGRPLREPGRRDGELANIYFLDDVSRAERAVDQTCARRAPCAGGGGGGLFGTGGDAST